MISKELMSEELMSEVLKLNITYIERCNNSIIYKISVYDREEEVNIYELAHKCKEWAYSKHGYLLNSRRTFKTKYLLGYCEVVKDCEFYYSEYSNTEVEAIFKACQWILDNKDK